MEIFLNFEVIGERENQMSKLFKNIKRSKGKINIKSKSKSKSKSDRAITLIALIATIIVLLILAGVTIANVMGNQGIIKKAKIATNNYDTQSANEEMELFLMGLGNDVTGDRLVDYLKNNK